MRGSFAVRTEIGELRQRFGLTGHHRQTSLTPRSDAAFEREGAVTALAEAARRTGARFLVRSGAERDERALERQLLRALAKLRRRNAERAGGHLTERRPGARFHDIDEDRFAALDETARVDRSDDEIFVVHDTITQHAACAAGSRPARPVGVHAGKDQQAVEIRSLRESRSPRRVARRLMDTALRDSDRAATRRPATAGSVGAGMGMDALVRYVCIDRAHARSARGAVGDLTVHSGSWAFCPADERTGHAWKHVGGLGVEGLVPFGLRGPVQPGAIPS